MTQEQIAAAREVKFLMASGRKLERADVLTLIRTSLAALRQASDPPDPTELLQALFSDIEAGRHIP